MRKTITGLVLIILLLAVSNIATAAVELVKVDLSCPGNAATKKGGDWADFEVGGGCDGDRHDPRGWIDPDTNIRFDAGHPGGHGNVKARGGDPICNTSYQQWEDEEGPMMLRISGAGHTAGDYTIEVLHAWGGGNISGLSVSGATSHTILQSGSVVNTESDADLLSAAGSHTLVDYTIASDGQSVTLQWSGITKINAWILYAAVAPPNALNPDPSNGASDVLPTADLSWEPGSGATSHDVYMGIDETAVANATTASTEYQGNVTEATYSPGMMVFGTTYYWRIDEVGDSVVIGDVWSFTVVDGKAADPTPSDEASWVPLDQQLSWTAGALATTHDVYFGTNETAVANATSASDEYKGIQAETGFDPGGLQEDTTYYWRIDEASHVITKGDVWSFTTVGGVGRIHLQVDLALPQWGTMEPWPGTAKEGWWPWVAGRWADMYSHDIVWERGEGGEGGTPPDTDGIAGTGIHATLNCGYEGQAGLHAKDLCRCNLAGDCPASGSIVGDPIANTWLYAVDWAGPVEGDIQLRFSALPPGEYELISYHNHWEPCTQGSRNCMRCTCGMPPMPSVTANPLPVNPRPGTRNWPFQAGTGAGVTAIQNAYDVHVTNVNSDDQVATSTVIFETDGTNDVLIIYEAPDFGYPDCARDGREGGRGILNAFELTQIGGCECLGDVSDTGGFGDPDGKVDIGDINALLFAMLEAYPEGDPTGLYEIDASGLPCGADCSDTGGFGAPDGKVDIGDLNALLFAMLGAYPDGDPTGMYEVSCLE